MPVAAWSCRFAIAAAVAGFAAPAPAADSLAAVQQGGQVRERTILAQNESPPGQAPSQAWTTLTPERFATLKNEYKFDIILMKWNRDLLKDEEWARYWITMNDCAATKHWTNEFVWPGIRDYYRKIEGKLLGDLPTQIFLDIPVELGKYDMEKKAFPMNARGNPINFSELTLNDQRSRLFYLGCPPGDVSNVVFRLNPPPSFVKFDKPFAPKWLAIPETVAAEFVGRVGADRRATLELVYTLSEPRTEKSYKGASNAVVFRGRIDSARVYERDKSRVLAQIDVGP